MSNNYWEDRELKARQRLAERGLREAEKQMRKYYRNSMKKILGQFELVYLQIFSKVEEGKTPTVADLYKLDAYWQMQSQLKRELQLLGDNQITFLTAKFVDMYADFYQSYGLKGMETFTQIDRKAALQVINQIWCADGKSWSQRVWENLSQLQATLNDKLAECVITGRKTTELNKELQTRFNVSYSRADTLIRTEIANVQTQAARKRYEDYGLTYYEIQGNEDDSCGNHAVDCHAMDGKRFKYSEMRAGVNAPPFHPNCRCGILPVVE